MAEPVSTTIAVGTGLASLWGALTGGGGMSKAEKNALKAQTEISQVMADIQKQQAAMDLPYRADLFKALRGRAQQERPRFLPGAPAQSNPFARMRQASPQTQAQGAPPPGAGQRYGPRQVGPQRAPANQGEGTLTQAIRRPMQYGAPPGNAPPVAQANRGGPRQIHNPVRNDIIPGVLGGGS